MSSEYRLFLQISNFGPPDLVCGGESQRTRYIGGVRLFWLMCFSRGDSLLKGPASKLNMLDKCNY